MASFSSFLLYHRGPTAPLGDYIRSRIATAATASSKSTITRCCCLFCGGGVGWSHDICFRDATFLNAYVGMDSLLDLEFWSSLLVASPIAFLSSLLVVSYYSFTLYYCVSVEECSNSCRSRSSNTFRHDFVSFRAMSYLTDALSGMKHRSKSKWKTCPLVSNNT